MVPATAGGKVWNWERREKKQRNTCGMQTEFTVYTCAFLYTTFCVVDKIIFISDSVLGKKKCVTVWDICPWLFVKLS